jgi:hypothetical protein
VSIDDFALRRRHRYGTVIIDAVTHRRIDVLPDRRPEPVAAWLNAHPGIDVVVRDGSTTYAEAIRRAAPGAMQASDRWHLWHGLAQAVERVVVAHSGCWSTVAPKYRQVKGGTTTTTLQRWHAVHDLLDRGVGLLDCARRLNLSLNTVKRYARAHEPDRLRRPPQYRPCLVDPYRDHSRTRRAADPGVPVLQLFDEIKALGYTGGLNLLYRYINQGWLNSDRITLSPKRVASWILTRPADLPDTRRAHLEEITAACPEMTALTDLVREFAQLLTERRGSDLDSWIKQVREASLTEIHPFLTGLEQDHDAAVAGLTLPYSNGPVERRTATFLRNHDGDPDQPTRSAITDAGSAGNCTSNSRTSGSNSSNAEGPDTR